MNLRDRWEEIRARPNNLKIMNVDPRDTLHQDIRHTRRAGVFAFGHRDGTWRSRSAGWIANWGI
jgi:hypothetical protein